MAVVFRLPAFEGDEVADFGDGGGRQVCHQFGKRHRRDAAALHRPTRGEQRAQDVKPFFQANLAVQIHRAEGIARDAAIVVQQRRGLRVLRREGVQVADKGAVCGINHRRAQPFEQHCVAFAQKTQRLADVPGADVKPFIFNKFKSVLAFVNRQIMRGRADVKRAHVVIAVGRGEAPGAAAAFHGEKEMQVFLLCQRGEFGGDGWHGVLSRKDAAG